MKKKPRNKASEAETSEALQTVNLYSVEIANEGTVTLSYDLNGNLLSRIDSSGTTTYDWNAANRLIKIAYPDSSSTEFQYDPFGRRERIIERNGSGSTTSDVYYAWDGFELVQEWESSNSDVRRRFFRHGVQVVSGGSDPTGDYFYTFDHLGSIREVTDDQGALVARYDYDPYGRTETVSGSFDADFPFTGHYYHEKSGLHLAPFRAYDADLGRWLNRDPLATIQPDGLAEPEMIHTLLNGYGELLPEGPGLYGYVGGDPVNFFDPFGYRRVRAWNPFTWTREVWVDAGNAALAGNAAFWDGINPFGNPFSHQYNECDQSLVWSRRIGGGTRDAALFAWGGATMAAARSSTGVVITPTRRFVASEFGPSWTTVIGGSINTRTLMIDHAGKWVSRSYTIGDFRRALNGGDCE